VGFSRGIWTAPKGDIWHPIFEKEAEKGKQELHVLEGAKTWPKRT